MANILLIDDDDQLRGMLKQLLETAGHEVHEANNGRAGVNWFKNEPVDLVITDIVMPDQEGLETIIELRKLQAGVRIIAISGGGVHQTTDYLDSAGMLGASRTLPKPCNSKELLATVANLLGSAAAGPA